MVFFKRRPSIAKIERRYVEAQETGAAGQSVSQIVASADHYATKAYVLFGTSYSFDSATGTFTLTGTLTRQVLTSFQDGYIQRTTPSKTNQFLVVSFDGEPPASGHSVIWKWPTSSTSRGRFGCSCSKSGDTADVTFNASSSYYNCSYTRYFSYLDE